MQNGKGAPDHFQNSGNMNNNATEWKCRWLEKIQCTGTLNENVTKKGMKMARKDAAYRDLELAGLWLVGEVDNHVAIYGSMVAEGFSAFQRWSCLHWDWGFSAIWIMKFQCYMCTGIIILSAPFSLQWRNNGLNGISNHQPYECLLNHLFRHKSKKTSKLHITGLCAGNSPVPGEFPAQRASNTESVSIW